MKTKTAGYQVKIQKVVSLTILYLFFFAALIINLTPFMDSQNALMDFGSFYASGLKAQNGENPYDPNSEYISLI